MQNMIGLTETIARFSPPVHYWNTKTLCGRPASSTSFTEVVELSTKQVDITQSW